MEWLFSKLETTNRINSFDVRFILLKFVLPHARRTRRVLLSKSAVLFLLLLLMSSRQAWVQYLSNSFLCFFFLASLPMWSNSVAGESVFGNLLLNISGYGETSEDKASTSRVNMLLGGQEIWQLLQKLDLMVRTNNLSVLVNVNSFPQSGCFCFVWTA